MLKRQCHGQRGLLVSGICALRAAEASRGQLLLANIEYTGAEKERTEDGIDAAEIACECGLGDHSRSSQECKHNFAGNSQARGRLRGEVIEGGREEECSLSRPEQLARDQQLQRHGDLHSCGAPDTCRPERQQSHAAVNSEFGAASEKEEKEGVLI